MFSLTLATPHDLPDAPNAILRFHLRDRTHFIECENQLQESRKLGEWNPVDYSKPDGLWELAFTQAEVEQFFREENQRILDLNTARHFAQLESKTKADAAYPEFLESDSSGG